MYFSTQMVDRADRRDAWLNALHGHCGPFDMDFGNGEFEGSVDARSVGRFQCARITQTSRQARRSRREVEKATGADFFVILQLSGRNQIEQAGNVAQLSANDIAVVDSAQPSRFVMDGKNVSLALHLPKPALEEMEVDWKPRLATPLPKSSATLIGSLIRSAYEQGRALDLARGRIVDNAIVELLAASWGDAIDGLEEWHRPAGLLKSIQDHVLGHLGDEDLSPSTIAKAHGVSERKVHRAFEGFGVSLCEWIRRSRLDRCAVELRDPYQGDRTITEIAFRWGFSSSAHFSRLFRAEFGLTPRAYRGGAASDLSG
jgi:AraC-like DNA-binding protein